MGESTKAVLSLLLIISLIVGAIAWTADRPDANTWAFRFGAPTTGLVALGLILKLHFRADLQTDYLRSIAGTYFNRDGFCFAFALGSVDGIAFIDAYFQTQYDSPCLGRIALRPARGFFLTRANIDVITFEVECPPSGFGVARIAIPIPAKLQGRAQSFEVGASASYSDGKGHRVRFHDGVFLRANTNFGNSMSTAITIAGAATGSIVLAKPVTVTLALPENVTEHLPDHIQPESRILWRPGDPPLERDG